MKSKTNGTYELQNNVSCNNKTETHYILFKQSVGNIEIIFAHSNISKKKPPQISTTC
jgi:hypothetical protein